MKLFEHWEVKWGIQPCVGRQRCDRMADLLYDGMPLCLDCADALLQRELAVGLLPALRDVLPDLWDE